MSRLASRTVAAQPIPLSEGLDRRPGLILHRGIISSPSCFGSTRSSSGAIALIRSENFAMFATLILTVVRLKLDFEDAKIMLVSWSMFRNYPAAKAGIIAAGK